MKYTKVSCASLTSKVIKLISTRFDLSSILGNKTMIKVTHKKRILNILCTFIFIGGVKINANADVFPGSLTPWLNTAPKSLSQQTLAASTYPHEAELFCSIEDCVFGLTHDLVVGGDALGMIAAPARRAFDPNWISGANLYIIDVFGGFQILRNVNKNSMNAQIGYRRIYLSDGDNQIYTQGITTAVNYSFIVTPEYEQGLQFSGYFILGSTASLNNTAALDVNSSGHGQLNTDASYFYRISQTYPTFRVSFPGDVELANWSSEQTNLNMPLRIYAHIEPFYIQNNLNFSGSNLSLQKMEQNFGTRLAGVTTYESIERDRSSRYALKGALGMDIASSQFTTISSGTTDLSLPNRPLVVPYIEIAGSFQF